MNDRSAASPERPRRRVIYDCDNTMGKPLSEIDDGLTLLYLLGREDLELVGVTTTFGNGALEDVLLPEMDARLAAIDNALDELEREAAVRVRRPRS